MRLLQSLEQMHSGVQARQQSNLGCAIKVAGDILAHRGGRLVVQWSGAADGAHLEDRQRWAAPRNILGTDEERVLYNVDAGNVFWKDLANWLTANALSLDLFVAQPAASYLDVATLTHATQQTGGHLFWYRDWKRPRDELRLREELRGRLLRRGGYDAVLRVRVSTGISVVGTRGGFNNDRVADELEVSFFFFFFFFAFTHL